MDKLIQILQMVKALPLMSVEFNYGGDVITCRSLEDLGCEIKTFNDDEPLENDGNLNACIAYLEAVKTEINKAA